MLINDIDRFFYNVKGVIHVGAHEGQELSFYKKIGVGNVIWIEPNKQVYKTLIENVSSYHRCFNVAIDEEEKKSILYIASNDGQSSSLLELGKHADFYPTITYVGNQEVSCVRLDSLFAKKQIDINYYNLINIDVQGKELSVLKSLGKLIENIDYVYTEVNIDTLYKGGALLQDIDDFLKEKGFIRVCTKLTNKQWGDALYCRKNLFRIVQESYNENLVDWCVLERLYHTNYVENKNKKQKIPKLIHQIWLGGPVPEKYHTWRNSWIDKNPDYSYKLWTDNDLQALDLPGGFYSIENKGQQSDYLRYFILEKFGGLYADTDFECVKNFDDLLHLDFFTGIGYGNIPELYIGVIGCAPHNKLMQSILENVVLEKQKNWKGIFNTTGSYYFTKQFLQNYKIAGSIVAFPTTFFYPFPKNGLLLPEHYCTDFSYAIHHWEVSWLKK